MALPWIILFAPLVSAVLIATVAKQSRVVSAFISVSAVLVSFVCAVIVFVLPAPAHPLEIPWIDLGPGVFQAPIGITLDTLSKAMLIVVTAIGALIHIYSLDYMSEDPGKSRYFAGLSLFMFSMLGIVFANNFAMMFIFWELVGVSSFILIGHWFDRPAPPAAANKAFIVNRIGDFGFMLGILLVWMATKSLNFAQIQASLPAFKATGPMFATVAVLCLFCGTVGKSAQFPLHVWLPDAMEGPTPVSALIHAATMVAAGVYMLARVYFLIEVSHNAQHVIAWIGTITAVLAALMATQQNDIKRILAYSTLSQLGFMVMAMGVAAPQAGMFHLFTHAFFKALLFLGAGAVIFACHHEQDIWKMGGLSPDKMPATFFTFLVGTLALMGVPFFSGFYSKDAILIAAFHHSLPIFCLALFAACLTAFYMTRLFVVAFLGQSRSEHAEHATEAPLLMWAPLVLLSVPSFLAGYSVIVHRFLPTPEEGFSMIALLPIAATAIGIVGGWMLYFGAAKDPIHIPLLARKFYFDEIYAGLIRYTQDLLARFSAFVDRWILDTLIIRTGAGCLWGFGFALRLFQVGNLQGYALLFAAGVIGLIYYVIFK